MTAHLAPDLIGAPGLLLLGFLLMLACVEGVARWFGSLKGRE